MEPDWPVQEFAYEDASHQRVCLETVPSRCVDFVACDPRYARHFARVPRAKWNGNMMPVGEYLTREPKSCAGQGAVPADGRRATTCCRG